MPLPDLQLRVASGLELTGRQSFLIEPNWSDVRDGLGIANDLFESAATTALPDSKSGPTSARSNNSRRKAGRSVFTGRYTFRPYNHQRIYNLFNHMRQWVGTARSFWMPSWCSDFRLARDLDPLEGNAMYVVPNGFEHVYEDRRYGVMVETLDRFLDIYECTGYDAASGCLFVSDTLQERTEIENVSRVSLVRRVRSGSDSFDWKFNTDAVADLPISVVETPREGVFQ